MAAKLDYEAAKIALKFIIEHRDVIGKVLDEFNLNMPNIAMPTMGGKVFWSDLVSVSGWRLQQNKLLGNCRILDDENRRVAWGGEDAMRQLIQKLSAV